MISSPNHTNHGKTSSPRDFTEKTLNSLQQKQCSELCDSVTLLGFPGNILEVPPVSSLRIHETEQRTSGDKELLKRKGKAIRDEEDQEEYNQSVKKRVGIYSRNYHNSFHFLMTEEDTSGRNHEKSSMLGPDNYDQNAESLPINLKEISPDPSRSEVLFASHIEVESAYSKGLDKMKSYQIASLAELSVSENSMLARYGTPAKLTSTSRSAEGRHADAPLNILIGRSDDRMPHNLTSISPNSRQCSDDSLCSDFRGINEVGMTIGSEPVDRARHRTRHTSHKNNSALVWCKSQCDLKSPKAQKAKEHVLYNIEGNTSILNEREDSYESVESSNSRNSVSTDKRPLSPDPQLSEASKKNKRQRNEYSCSVSAVRQGSSFMSWISTITSGYKRSEFATPLSFIPHTSPNAKKSLSALPASNEKIKSVDNSLRSEGFKSIFQAMYRSSFKTQNSSCNASEHRASSEELVHGSFPMECDNVKPNICNVIPTTSESTSSDLKEHTPSESLKLVFDANSNTLPDRVSVLSEMHNQDPCQVEEFPLTTVDIPFMNSAVYEKPRCSVKIITEPPGNKGPDMPLSVPNSSIDTMTNRSSFLENMWIQRLLTPKAGTTLCNQDKESASVKLTKDCSILNPPVVFSNKEQSSSKNHQFLSLEGPWGVMKNEKQDYSLSFIDPGSTKRTTDQKFKSNLNQILPSRRFKELEPMASVFAKRLDAFRHIRPSIISSDATCSTNICCYCGKTGHSIQMCSELDETELEYLMKNMNSYKGTIDSSCLCIRCFQLSHWAALCPLASSQRKIFTDNDYLISDHNCNRINNKTGNHNSSYDGGALIWSGDEEGRHRDNVLVNPDATSGMGKAIDSNNLCLNLVKRQKPTSSGSDENESKGNQIIPNTYFTSTEEADYSIEIFERIRKLRLSRTDIIRLMKSPVAHSSMKGFFLRIRLGKGGEGFGETGYQVAQINGVNDNNSLSTCIGGFTYSVDYHSVSNQDFIEDELRAWWSTILKGSGKPPTIQELDKKLGERMVFGF